MRCQCCKVEYPIVLLSWMTTSDGLMSLVCGICALKETNKIHGINRTKFDGPQAEKKRLAAIEYRKSMNYEKES